MAADLGDLNAFVAVARAGGFRDAAHTAGRSAPACVVTIAAWLNP